MNYSFTLLQNFAKSVRVAGSDGLEPGRSPTPPREGEWGVPDPGLSYHQPVVTLDAQGFRGNTQTITAREPKQGRDLLTVGFCQRLSVPGFEPANCPIFTIVNLAL